MPKFYKFWPKPEILTAFDLKKPKLWQILTLKKQNFNIRKPKPKPEISTNKDQNVDKFGQKHCPTHRER